jgi:glycosyltransferase involved in cell wall biosynthesis
MVSIPPPGYAGTERIVGVLVEELSRRGHAVTLIGPGDSRVRCELVPTIERALWSSGMRGDVTPYIQVSIERAWAECHRFDVIHSHLDTLSFALARHCPTPVVHTLHGTAIEDGTASYEGELGAAERDRLLAGAAATVMLGAWPEPFGLVAIESMATGTPVIARRAGALTEIVEHGRTGFLVDDLQEGQLAVREVLELDRAEVRRIAIERFNVERMVDDYEAIYRRLAGGEPSGTPDHAPSNGAALAGGGAKPR